MFTYVRRDVLDFCDLVMRSLQLLFEFPRILVHGYLRSPNTLLGRSEEGALGRREELR
jgi:hypothetical protein